MIQESQRPALLPLRFGVIYAALFLQFGFLLPYWPVYLKSRGLDAQEIGLFYAVMGYARVITIPLAAMIGERFGQGMRYLLALALIGAVPYALFAAAGDLFAYLLLAVGIATFLPSLMAILDSKALALAHTGAIAYGRARLWGSATFILVNLGGGALIGAMGPKHINWMLCGSALISAVSFLLLPDAAPSGGGRRRLALREFRSLLLDRRIMAFIVAAGLGQAAHSVFYTFGTLDWQRLGYSETLIGALWAIGVLAEIGLFAIGQRLSARFAPGTLAMIAVGVSAVRWVAMAFNPPLWALVGLQTLHAFSFGALHLAAMSGLHRMVPPALSATAQGLYAAMSGGVLMATASGIAGTLYESHGRLAYVFGAVLASTAFLMFWGLRNLKATAPSAPE